MFITRHQRVCVIAFCGAGSAWFSPGHSGHYHELCLEIPGPRTVPSCPSQSILLTYVVSHAIPLSKSYLIPHSPHSLPSLPPWASPTQPLSQNPSFHPIRIQVPWGEGWGSSHSLRLSKNTRHTVKTSECKSVEWKLCVLASVPKQSLSGGREKTMCSSGVYARRWSS